jgi:hypothetical protein
MHQTQMSSIFFSSTSLDQIFVFSYELQVKICKSLLRLYSFTVFKRFPFRDTNDLFSNYHCLCRRTPSEVVNPFYAYTISHNGHTQTAFLRNGFSHESKDCWVQESISHIFYTPADCPWSYAAFSYAWYNLGRTDILYRSHDIWRRTRGSIPFWNVAIIPLWIDMLFRRSYSYKFLPCLGTTEIYWDVVSLVVVQLLRKDGRLRQIQS